MATITDKKRKQEHNGFSPSVNIIRDADNALHYIPTTNSKQVFTQLINDYQTGIRSFTIVGAYGIGKSAFLWAFEKNINHKQYYFSKLGNNIPVKEFKFIRLVGQYNSLRNEVASQLNLDTKKLTSEVLLSSLNKYYKALAKTGKGLVIVVDEFGKFLEYAAKNNPENELYFIQELAEYVNDVKKNIIFITTLHQDFNGYSRGLTQTQQNEWDKVKGRLKEITFNEPVEQLLFLASERLSELKFGQKDKQFSKLFKCIEAAKAFPLKDYFSESFAEKLLPFDILSAAVLTLSLQKYGQNERSLFSFIESNDHLGIRNFKNDQAPYYNVANLYDYLVYNFNSLLTTKFNPHYTQWAAMRIAIERAEGLLGNEVTDALKLVKTIGLLNIFATASARINRTFLADYGKYSLGIKQPAAIIAKLEGFKIIRYVKHSDKLILFEGTDLDIELAINEAGNLVERVVNTVHHLSKYFDFPYIPAKEVHYERGTPRLFAFCLTEEPWVQAPENEVDGIINLIFSDKVSEKDIRVVSESNREAILYGLYKNTDEIRNLLFEIEKIEKVRENNKEDRVALRELNGILQHQVKLLNHYVLANIYAGDQSSIVWYFNGERKTFQNEKSFNQFLSSICNEVYPNTPIYKNEMINKTKLSGALSSAKKNLLKNLIDNWNLADIGFENTKFPPEKTVYLSLLRETGMHRQQGVGYILAEPTSESFNRLWMACNNFLNEARSGKRNLQDLVDILLTKPFKLKKGFIDFWLPIFLFCKRDDFALFQENRYIPQLTIDTLDLVSKAPGDYEIKAFDIAGVRLSIFNSYRNMLSQAEQEKATNSLFIETIRPFLTFYKDLPEYAKHTRSLDKKTLALREAIATAKDPEQTFFEHFPKAMGFSIIELQQNPHELESFINQLQQSIRDIRNCYGDLLDSFELFIQDEIIGSNEQFPTYKSTLQKRFLHVKKHLLQQNQRVFVQRINSELDDRNAWLNAIAQACIGKALSVISDSEKHILFDRMKDMVHELDNLSEISNFNEDKEIAFKLEVTSFVQGLQKNLIRLPKTKNKAYIQLQDKVKSQLGRDKQLNIATLAKLLEELLRNEK
ncbi:hypothetical protein [Sediminibacterium goheungense]|uniref:ATP-binding protein n=1 Tax=Sediminibacterium goheungense TaxID=1086393 RepID=A0A4R6J1T9_9BACT|nr:hypothetical protein [Sediminibacterium goheungense]TDO29230.1 hypothetical protein BC659_1313 [Sediminibacterium goheungense]